jgi:hypothetical protein
MAEPIHILEPIRRKWWRPTRIALAALGILGCLIGGCYAWRKHEYPYGWSHVCDKQLFMALQDYAETHGGWFPAGESSPEASLSLLYKGNRFVPECAYLLAGKRLAEKGVQAVLDRGERLGPDTCGWNYVEGLRSDDDDRLALFWDKEGLNHNGGRLSGGGHVVIFMHCRNEHINAKDWPDFLSRQEELWTALTADGRQIRISEAGRTPAGGKP